MQGGLYDTYDVGTDSYSLESMLEMSRTFGARHNRAKEIEWALNRVLRQTK
jgi:hypothetical protein